MLDSTGHSCKVDPVWEMSAPAHSWVYSLKMACSRQRYLCEVKARMIGDLRQQKAGAGFETTILLWMVSSLHPYLGKQSTTLVARFFLGFCSSSDDPTCLYSPSSWSKQGLRGKKEEHYKNQYSNISTQCLSLGRSSSGILFDIWLCSWILIWRVLSSY